MVPSITDRSEWHTPLAVTRTTTSRGPGGRGVSSSTTSGWWRSRNTAARMGETVALGGVPIACDAVDEPPVTSLLLVRHGQSVWNADGRWQGQADPPLSALGEQQAVEAANRLDGIDAVGTSDLVRHARTADLLAHELGVDVVVDARWRERHAGEWQGHTRAEIEWA